MIPSVVTGNALVRIAGKLTVSVPIMTPLGPIIIVIPSSVTVELVGPSVNVELPIMTSVAGNVGFKFGSDVGADEL